jgi:hypothetical protein
MIGFSGAYGRWTADFEERNRFLWIPLTGSPLARLRAISTAIAGVAFLVVGIAAWMAS